MVQTDFRTALKGTNEIEITVTGRSFSSPVWFALEGEKLSLLPARGSDTDWYKNVRKRPSIRLEARGKTFTTSATPITDEAQHLPDQSSHRHPRLSAHLPVCGSIDSAGRTEP